MRPSPYKKLPYKEACIIDVPVPAKPQPEVQE
jgi:hypothetical protein